MRVEGAGAELSSSIDEDIEAGRVVLAAHCGTCHQPEQPTAKPGALAVFSVSEPDWTVRMTEAQLCSSVARIQKSRDVQPERAESFASAVDRILARRNAAGCQGRAGGL